MPEEGSVLTDIDTSLDTEHEVPDDSAVFVGGPGQEGDNLTPPEEGREVEAEAPETEPTAPAPKFKYKDQNAAEKAVLDATRKMTEATEKASRYEKMLSTLSGPKPVTQPVTKSLVDRIQAEVDDKIKHLAVPIDYETNPTTRAEYDSQVRKLYWEGNQRLAVETARAEKQQMDDTQRRISYITTKAKEFGMSDENFKIKNEDGTDLDANLLNVFYGVSANAQAFGIPLTDPTTGQWLPMDQQILNTTKAIQRFLDGYVEYKSSKKQDVVKQQNKMKVLGGGSRVSGKTSNEPDRIPTWKEQVEASKKRVKASDLS